MVLASAGVIAVEQVPRNGCHQHLCPPGGPSCLLLLQEALQDQQVDLIRTLFIPLPLHWNLDYVRFCACFLKAESLFPIASSSPEHEPHWFSKPDVLWSYLLSVGYPGWRA